MIIITINNNNRYFCCQQSAEAMTMVKNDLSEFVCTIQHDTSTAVADTANAVKETLKVRIGTRFPK